VPYGDHEVATDEQHHVPGLHDLGRVGQLAVLDVTRRAQSGERHRRIALDLRALVALQGILDRKLVQLERFGDCLQLIGPRLMKAEPHERVRITANHVERLGVVPRPGLSPAVHVDRAVHDRAVHRAAAVA
jgi:hypothetical protein